MEVNDAASYSQRWGMLRTSEGLWVPVTLTPEGGGTEVELDPVIDQLGDVRVQLEDGTWCGVAYTDSALLTEFSDYTKAQPAYVLDRHLHHPLMDGVGIDAALEVEFEIEGTDKSLMVSHGKEGETALSNIDVAELVGFLVSPDPLAQTPDHNHATLSMDALGADEPCAALYHARRAQADGHGVGEYFFPLLDALITLRLHEHVNDALAWYETQESQNPLIDVYHARCLTLSGEPESAAELAHKASQHVDINPMARLELGRAQLAMEQNQEAFDSFESVLQDEPKNVHALLGKAAAVRDVSLARQDEAGFNQALGLLNDVLQIEGYHRAEAWHHIATIYLAAGMYEQALQAARRSLNLRDNPFVRRNLVVALHATGNDEQAKKAFQALEPFPEAQSGLGELFA